MSRYIIPTYNPSEKFELKIVKECLHDVIGYEEKCYQVEKVFGNIRWEEEDRYIRQCLIGHLYKIVERQDNTRYEQLSLF